VRIKLDENITIAAKPLLVAAGYDADTVHDEALTGTDDEKLIEICRREERLLVTFDVGFGDVRAHPPGSHSGVVLLRLRDQQPPAVLDVIRRLVADYDLASFAGALAVVSDERVRIRRPAVAAGPPICVGHVGTHPARKPAGTGRHQWTRAGTQCPGQVGCRR
jgi:predicted nuclease of predicted toxin-antitoxin system